MKQNLDPVCIILKCHNANVGVSAKVGLIRLSLYNSIRIRPSNKFLAEEVMQEIF